MEFEHEIGAGASEEVAEGMNSAFQQDVAVDEGHFVQACAWDFVVLPAAFAGEAVIVNKTDDLSQPGLQGAVSEATNLDSRAGLVEDVAEAGAGEGAEAEAAEPVAELEKQDEAGAVAVASGNEAADTEVCAHIADEDELEEVVEPEVVNGPGLLGKFVLEFESVVASYGEFAAVDWLVLGSEVEQPQAPEQISVNESGPVVEVGVGVGVVSGGILDSVQPFVMH